MKNKLQTKKHFTFGMNKANQLFLNDSIWCKIATQRSPKLLMITTFPPRECGIATYSQDLIHAINNKFSVSFNIIICTLENSNYSYSDKVQYSLETQNSQSYSQLTLDINASQDIELVVLQHEFGLFKDNENDLLQMLYNLNKAVVVVFHTVLPKPDAEIQTYIQNIAIYSKAIIVMTHTSKEILVDNYLIDDSKINVIPHGTHLVEHTDRNFLKEKYGLQNKLILSTFGLISSGKNIQSTLNALPKIIENHPEVLFLIIGKTHPSVVKQEGEKYRESLIQLIDELKLIDHVLFVNEYLPLDILLEYLQMTDIYLFTSNDPNQAVSGTFSYAISCGCAIISTPIPHAKEVLKNGVGIMVDFDNSAELAKEVNQLLDNEIERNKYSLNGLHQIAPTVWENAALNHINLFEKLTKKPMKIKLKTPSINLNHVKKMTTHFGMIQFSILNNPDTESGYTLDDNARALIAMCQHYKQYRNEDDLISIQLYFDFITYCYQENGYFLNYINFQQEFTSQNNSCNLEDSYGRAIWALGYMLSIQNILPKEMVDNAQRLFKKAILKTVNIHSTRAMAFIIKGLYFANKHNQTENYSPIIAHFADKLVQMYKHEADENWKWYESYLTYANSVLPEALLFAWKTTQNPKYKTIALDSFDFLLSKIFKDNQIHVISNKTWLHNGQSINVTEKGGEQPIDVAYTILALHEFYKTLKTESYKEKIRIAFNWFLGRNHLNQIIYNPCTGGCYDGLEDNYINLNQGAESTLSYLMARLTVEKYDRKTINFQNKEQQNHIIKL